MDVKSRREESQQTACATTRFARQVVKRIDHFGSDGNEFAVLR